MSKVAIDMPEFQRYIRKMSQMVQNIVESNRIFTQKIEACESEWYDDVYKRARNQLFRMQGETNRFINQLRDLDNDLVTWYCDLCDKYAHLPAYIRPVVDMPMVQIKDEQLERHDERYYVSSSALQDYVQSTRAYSQNIRQELQAFQEDNQKFGEYFKTKKYDEITYRLLPIIRKMVDILNDMDGLAAAVADKISTVQQHEE